MSLGKKIRDILDYQITASDDGDVLKFEYDRVGTVLKLIPFIETEKAKAVRKTATGVRDNFWSKASLEVRYGGDVWKITKKDFNEIIDKLLEGEK